MIQRGLLLFAGVGIWFAACVGALMLIAAYKATPGPSGAVPEIWPTESAIRLKAGVANVVLFAHPQCPCTKASMTELGRLADALGPSASFQVVLVDPVDAEAGFDEGPIARRARAIGAGIFVDRGGDEATRFGAIVSGSTVVYDAAGKLVFHGGLTVARGHEGRAPAFDSIVAAVRDHDVPQQRATPTFGCTIASPELATK